MKANSKEHGFTLVELLVVILVIGILAAIAIPAFLNQRKEATMATVKTDLKNAALIMKSDSLKNSGKYSTALPDYTGFSDGNLLSTVPAFSNNEQICIEGHNTSLNRSLYYSSEDGGLLAEGKTCSPVTNGASYSMINKERKILIVEHGQATPSATYARKVFIAQGYENSNIETIISGSLTKEALKDVDILAVMSQAWVLNTQDYTLALEFYDQGGKVLAEGNDNQFTRFVSEGKFKTNSSVSFNPTHNVTNPSFPYSFRDEAFASDSNWRCLMKLQNGAVAIASSSPDDDTCISLFAVSNSNGGQFIGLTFAKVSNDANIKYSQTYASIAWLSNR